MKISALCHCRLSPAVLLTVCTLLSAQPVHAQRDLKNIPVPDPELERSTFRLPEGFEVNLFAADPAIAKPIQMNFDEHGRLWVVSSEVYPHIEPGAEAVDRVLVLEDKDHDGVSDQTHIFADGLLIPTGIAPGDGGAYVANSTELLHFADTDGDLKADSKRVVLSGFGTEDTHHILHTLRWGADGFLYFNQSIYIHSHIETPWGVRRLNAGGIWQFRPETLELGVLMRGLVNTWGHHFDRFGQSFATDGAGGEGINYVVPGAYYFTAADAPEILHGLNPGSPKHCGLEIVETPALPPDWQGSAITNDFRGHRVCRFVLTEDRSGYISREQQEVIASDHVAFRPIDVKLGPDGAIYIADWYNPIIQHGEVDFRDPRRDHTHGRIWRVRWTGAPPQADLNIAEMSNAELFELISGNDSFRRLAAHQVLRQRGEQVLPDLKSWVNQLPNTADALTQKLEALWCCQGARTIDDQLLTELLNCEDGRVRAAAVRVLSHWKYQVPNGTGRLKTFVNDVHPRVRLEAVRGLAYSSLEDCEFQAAMFNADADSQAALIAQRDDPTKVNAVLQATDHPTDVFLDYAVRLSVRELASQWQPAFREGKIHFENIDHLLTAFSAVGQGAPVDVLLGRLNDSSLNDEKQGQLASLISTSGTPEQIAQLVSTSATSGKGRLIETALAETARRHLAVPVSAKAVNELLTVTEPSVKAVLLKASGQWKWPGFQNQLAGIARDAAADVVSRRAALEGLALSGEPAALAVVQEIAAAANQPTPLRIHATAMLTSLRPGQAAKIAVGVFAASSVEQHPEDLMRSFLTTRNGDTLLATALKEANLPLSSEVARELLRIARESGRTNADLENALKAAGNITSRRTMSDDEKAALLNAVQTTASAADGEIVFRNQKLGCLKCHAIGGSGGRVGPDMVSLGGSAQPDYLLESLLNPNAKVKENYHTIVVATTEGKVLSGVQVKRAKDEIIIRTADDQLVTIPGNQVEDVAAGVSLMPEGQVDTLTDGELASLVRFLSELGRTPEYSIGRRLFARTWEVMQATDQAAYQLRRTSYGTAAGDDPAYTWQPQYSMVNGSLPLSDIPVVSVKNRSAAGTRGVGFARCYLQVETAGKVSIRLNDTSGLEVRLNQRPIDVDDTMTFDVTPGRHRLTFSVDREVRNVPLQLEFLTDETTAVATFVN